jgi:hypothetical protein
VFGHHFRKLPVGCLKGIKVAIKLAVESDKLPVGYHWFINDDL